MTVDIDVVRTVDCTDLVSALEAEGFSSVLVEDRDHVWVRVAGDDSDQQRLQTSVLNALDAWVVGREVPLVITPLDEGCYCVHPPGD